MEQVSRAKQLWLKIKMYAVIYYCTLAALFWLNIVWIFADTAGYITGLGTTGGGCYGAQDIGVGTPVEGLFSGIANMVTGLFYTQSNGAETTKPFIKLFRDNILLDYRFIVIKYLLTVIYMIFVGYKYLMPEADIDVEPPTFRGFLKTAFYLGMVHAALNPKSYFLFDNYLTPIVLGILHDLTGIMIKNTISAFSIQGNLMNSGDPYILFDTVVGSLFSGSIVGKLRAMILSGVGVFVPLILFCYILISISFLRFLVNLIVAKILIAFGLMMVPVATILFLGNKSTKSVAKTFYSEMFVESIIFLTMYVFGISLLIGLMLDVLGGVFNFRACQEIMNPITILFTMLGLNESWLGDFVNGLGFMPVWKADSIYQGDIILSILALFIFVYFIDNIKGIVEKISTNIFNISFFGSSKAGSFANTATGISNSTISDIRQATVGEVVDGQFRGGTLVKGAANAIDKVIHSNGKNKKISVRDLLEEVVTGKPKNQIERLFGDKKNTLTETNRQKALQNLVKEAKKTLTDEYNKLGLNTKTAEFANDVRQLVNASLKNKDSEMLSDWHDKHKQKRQENMKGITDKLSDKFSWLKRKAIGSGIMNKDLREDLDKYGSYSDSEINSATMAVLFDAKQKPVKAKSKETMLVHRSLDLIKDKLDEGMSLDSAIAAAEEEYISSVDQGYLEDSGYTEHLRQYFRDTVAGSRDILDDMVLKRNAQAKKDGTIQYVNTYVSPEDLKKSQQKMNANLQEVSKLLGRSKNEINAEALRKLKRYSNYNQSKGNKFFGDLIKEIDNINNFYDNNVKDADTVNISNKVMDSYYKYLKTQNDYLAKINDAKTTEEKTAILQEGEKELNQILDDLKKDERLSILMGENYSDSTNESNLEQDRGLETEQPEREQDRGLETEQPEREQDQATQIDNLLDSIGSNYVKEIVNKTLELSPDSDKKQELMDVIRENKDSLQELNIASQGVIINIAQATKITNQDYEDNIALNKDKDKADLAIDIIKNYAAMSKIIKDQNIREPEVFKDLQERVKAIKIIENTIKKKK